MNTITNLPTYPINPNFSVKLDETSYLIWKEKLKHVIFVYRLQSLIDGSTPITSILVKKQITSETGEIQESFENNYEYHLWER